MSDLWDEELTLEECLRAGANGVDIPNEHYHELQGLSGSQLSLLAESNLHYENRRLFSPGNRDCFTFGTLVHTLSLEPHKTNNYCIMPTFETKAKSGVTIAEQKAEFLEDHHDKIIVTSADYEKAERMAENVRAICGGFLDDALIERSLFAEYAPGVVIKCRIDAQVGIDDYDLKTITPKAMSMSEVTLKHHTKDFGYIQSAAFRNVVRRSLGCDVGDSYLIYVATTPGHMVKIRRIPPALIAEAEDAGHDLLLLRRRWLKNNTDIDIKDILA